MTIDQALHYRIHEQHRFLVARQIQEEYAALPTVPSDQLQPGGEYYGRDSYEERRFGQRYTFVRRSPRGAKLVFDTHAGRIDMSHSVYQRKEFRVIPLELQAVLFCTPEKYGEMVCVMRAAGYQIAPVVIRENIAALYPDCAEFAGKRLDYLACLSTVERAAEVERVRVENARDVKILEFLEKHPEIAGRS